MLRLIAVIVIPVFLSTAAPPSQQLGLYNETDKVLVLTDTNFNDVVLRQNRSTLVQFYNSYCGHCKRFAPSYKLLANQLQRWHDVLPICAVDCAADEGNDICRDYEIMSYPSLRYFGPDYIKSNENYGRPIETQQLDDIRSILAQFLMAENRTARMTSWPNLEDVKENDIASLFNKSQYVVLIFDENNATLATETALHLLRWSDIEVRRVTSHAVATKYQINEDTSKIAIVNPNDSVILLTPLLNTSESYAEAIENFLRTKQLTERPFVLDAYKSSTSSAVLKHINSETISTAKDQYVYQADFEMAVRGVVFNEITKLDHINGERLVALQRFLAVLKKYNPLGEQGIMFVKELNDYALQFSKEISGEQFKEKAKLLASEHSPVFSAKDYVGCISSRPGLRGFTCSLWKLFHFMTVAAARTELSEDPLEVLQAMHDYVKHFFGCTECSSHFQSMAKRRSLWSTKTNDEAVLWLWAAHNEVNKRLSGDITEDPDFPKEQFPNQHNCSKCYKSSIQVQNISENDWDKTEVLNFLKMIYNPANISHHGLSDDSNMLSDPSMLRHKRETTSVFSDMDMHMGMLLYGFCIIMMVVVFKLFAFKGYRKKSYGHDMLWKV